MKNKRYQYPKIEFVSKVTGMAEMPLFWEYMVEFARMKYEQGADSAKIQELVDAAVNMVRETSVKLQSLPDDRQLSQLEPNDYEEILRARPERKSSGSKDSRPNAETYARKIRGAVLGRFAGCTLGAPVEFWSVEEMQEWAGYCGQNFPPEEYWKKTKNPNGLRYEVSIFEEYEQENLNKVPVDDDVTYTVLGLLILEEYGIDFTTKEVGAVWRKLLPRACTAEEVVLNHLRTGVDADRAADLSNPYAQWIGADIRADAWGYAAPGQPQKAARLAYRDAYLTHRRNGIYGEMFFAAVIAAAFTAENLEEAVQRGLEQIPEHCLLSQDIRWAMQRQEAIGDYKQARAEAVHYFDGMSGVHTNLNACLTLWGLFIGRDDFTKVIGQVTAMGYDNDCNAATAGSIFGALYGVEAIPPKWYLCFNNRVETYLNNHRFLEIEEICQRFTQFAMD